MWIATRVAGRSDTARRVRAILPSSCTSGSGRIAMQSPIRNVSDTALWMAMYRAFESERDDALFVDRHARHLAGARGTAIVRALPHGQSMAWAMVVRTAVIDEVVRACVAKGARTVVNLGCGLDTRAYRLDLPPRLRWLDIDLPGMVAYRRSRLDGEAAACDHADVAADVGESGALAGVLDLARASAGPLLVLTEGLLVYLERAQVEALARGLRAEPLARWWLTDLIAPLLLNTVGRRWKPHLLPAHAPLRFAPADGTTFFAPLGWREAERRSIWDESLRLHRPAPLSWFWGPLGALWFPGAQQSLQRLASVVLLERSDATGVDSLPALIHLTGAASR
jgi:methyltransferase (TIGR00027 family)